MTARNRGLASLVRPVIRRVLRPDGRGSENAVEELRRPLAPIPELFDPFDGYEAPVVGVGYDFGWLERANRGEVWFGDPVLDIRELLARQPSAEEEQADGER